MSRELLTSTARSVKVGNVSKEQQPATSEVTTFLTLKEAGAYLGVSHETVRLWIADGRLPALRLGPAGRYRINRADLDGMVKAA